MYNVWEKSDDNVFNAVRTDILVKVIAGILIVLFLRKRDPNM